MGGLEPPYDLTIPEAGSTTARQVLSRAVGALVKDFSGLARAAAAARVGALPDIAAFQRAAAGALAASPGAVASALRSPTIGALVRCLKPGRAPAGSFAEATLAELMALFGLELARAGLLKEPLRLRRIPRRLLSLPGHFEIVLPPDASGLALENGRARVERGPGRPSIELDLDRVAGGGAAAPVINEAIQVNWPYRRVDGDIALALADNNPLAMLEAHPDKEGNAIDLGGRPEEAWISALRGALALVEQYMPELRAEMALYVHQIVPVGFSTERHLSASYQEAIGTIYMSLHPSPMTMVEALLHEFSHNKLNALFEIDEVLENAWSPLYASPVRPDPRPLHGVLLAVHAFLPVARFYERMLEAGDPRAEGASFAARFAAIRRVNREGAAVVLEHARATPIGQGLIDEIRRWDLYYTQRAIAAR